MEKPRSQPDVNNSKRGFRDVRITLGNFARSHEGVNHCGVLVLIVRTLRHRNKETFVNLIMQQNGEWFFSFRGEIKGQWTHVVFVVWWCGRTEHSHVWL